MKFLEKGEYSFTCWENPVVRVNDDGDLNYKRRTLYTNIKEKILLLWRQ